MKMHVVQTKNLDEKVRPTPEREHEETPREYLYCEGPACSYAWMQPPIPLREGQSVRQYRGKIPHIAFYCNKCYAALCSEEMEKCPIYLDNTINVAGLPRLRRLESYACLVNNCKTYFAAATFIVILLPLVALLHASSGGRRLLPKRVCELWSVVSKPRVVATFTFLGLNYLGIAMCFPFASQSVYWGLMELYNVLFAIVNLLNHTPLNGYVNVVDKMRQVRHPVFQMMMLFFRACTAGLAPCMGIVEPLALILSAPMHSLVYFAGSKAGIDVGNLRISDGDISLVPGAFVGYASLERIREVVGWRRFLMALGIVCSMTLNGLLLLSWVPGALPTVPFYVPGVTTLVGSPENALYTISGRMVPTTCVPATPGSVTGLWSLTIDPPPTTDRGLPLLSLRLFNATSVVPYTVTMAWSINLVNQSSTDIYFYPLADQGYFSLLGTFHGTCADVANFTLDTKTHYLTTSIQQYVSDQTISFPLVLFPLYLIAKQMAQCSIMAVSVGSVAARIWALWIKFTAITTDGLFPPFSGSAVAVNLAVREYLIGWMGLRKAVVCATKLLASYIKVFLSLALIQLAIAVGGLLVYALTDNGPMPTYLLLIIALVNALSTLVFLYPLSEAMELMASHGDMLRDVHLHLLLADKPVLKDDTVVHVLTAFIDVVDNHDDRIHFWHIDVSKDRLRDLIVTLASGLSFIASKSVKFAWSDANPFFVGTQTSIWSS
ncbi:hypothetical protein ACHHYP_02472 [Achlya hypogyna]|uniref:Transmembrane protein n=1 Tax=Achlya hypogyna TaxID=1202772 RepID=A0A1V9Z6R2_ACHHY|nr:hypothetical protein ACHHYP_02472 [Achlya hypogyna]